MAAIPLGGIAAVLSACGPQYSPNTYSSAAVQQANKVDRGMVIGVRKVDVSAPGVLGAAAGGAAGGIVGSQTPGSVGSAFGTLGGALVGGIIGSGVEHATADTTAYEYVVRKPGGEMVSVTQKDKMPLPVGTKVLVISGSQARIVQDYTVENEPPQTEVTATPLARTEPTSAPPPPAVEATPLAPPPPLPAFPSPGQ